MQFNDDYLKLELVPVTEAVSAVDRRTEDPLDSPYSQVGARPHSRVPTASVILVSPTFVGRSSTDFATEVRAGRIPCLHSRIRVGGYFYCLRCESRLGPRISVSAPVLLRGAEQAPLVPSG